MGGWAGERAGPEKSRDASVHRRPGGYGEGGSTRSHPELGSESPQRQWYFGLSRGRVGRRQAFREQNKPSSKKNFAKSKITDPKTDRYTLQHARHPTRAQGAARKRREGRSP